LILLQKAEVPTNAYFTYPDGRGQAFNCQPPVTAQAIQNRGPRSFQNMFNRRCHDYIVESRPSFVNQTISKSSAKSLAL
jgi:hypothetical protein